tara:strand:- start:2861 stop:3106 length:246 start_codon:yes stop_codon:yes gene_type:complete
MTDNNMNNVASRRRRAALLRQQKEEEAAMNEIMKHFATNQNDTAFVRESHDNQVIKMNNNERIKRTRMQNAKGTSGMFIKP